MKGASQRRIVEEIIRTLSLVKGWALFFYYPFLGLGGRGAQLPSMRRFSGRIIRKRRVSVK